MKLSKNQKGFGLIEGLLVVIALTLVFGVGYYVYNQNKGTNKQQSSTDTVEKAQTSKQPAEKKTEYFEFKELGIKIPLNKGLAGLDYQMENNYLFLTTDGIVAAKNNCDPNGTLGSNASAKSFASISRQTGIYPSDPGIDDGDLMKQFDGFYITAGYPNGLGCPPNATGRASNDYSDKVTSAQKALKQAFKNAQVIQ